MIIFLNPDGRDAFGKTLPPAPNVAQWLNRINEGARFRLDFVDELSGPINEPYLRLPLARDNEKGFTFTELAFFLYNRRVGALLCHTDGKVGDGADFLQVSCGDIADFLLTGTLPYRVPCTPPWGYPGDFPEDFLGPLENPDTDILPYNVRQNLAYLSKGLEMRVSLIKRDNGLQYLWFSYKTEHDMSDEM